MEVGKDDRLILVTNDDGLYAAGLRTLLEVMEEFGKVVLVSTMESQSGMSQKTKSACSPSDTRWLKPMRRDRAQSSIAVISAPDCVTKAATPPPDFSS